MFWYRANGGRGPPGNAWWSLGEVMCAAQFSEAGLCLHKLKLCDSERRSNAPKQCRHSQILRPNPTPSRLSPLHSHKTSLVKTRDCRQKDEGRPIHAAPQDGALLDIIRNLILDPCVKNSFAEGLHKLALNGGGPCPTRVWRIGGLCALMACVHMLFAEGAR